MATGGKSVKFSSLFGPDNIICRTPLQGRDEILMALTQMLARKHSFSDVQAAYDAVIRREEQMPTLLAPGVAVPHGRMEGIDRMIVAVATSLPGIRFGEEPEDVAHLVVLMLAPKDSPGAHLKALSSLSKILREDRVAKSLADLESAEEIWRFFDRGGLLLPAHVCAGDIMSTAFVKLRENDTLETAIDMFVRHGVDELPVVDNEGDLAGVVSEEALLHICLPDYILWMEDLSPIIDFQPFAQLLRDEGKTWLTDIMSDEYCTVQADAPAIQVAKEMSRRDQRRVFVLKDKRLVGVITIQDFIDKVLRE